MTRPFSLVLQNAVKYPEHSNYFDIALAHKAVPCVSMLITTIEELEEELTDTQTSVEKYSECLSILNLEDEKIESIEIFRSHLETLLDYVQAIFLYSKNNGDNELYESLEYIKELLNHTSPKEEYRTKEYREDILNILREK